jgi:hypothetical protein
MEMSCGDAAPTRSEEPFRGVVLDTGQQEFPESLPGVSRRKRLRRFTVFIVQDLWGKNAQETAVALSV